MCSINIRGGKGDNFYLNQRMKKNIFIISLSPALDYVLHFEELKKNKTNRPIKIDLYPSGKGIHVSMFLNNLGVENKSLIFTNGLFENYFYDNLDKFGIKYQKFKADRDIRINLKLIDEMQTECSVSTSEINDSEIEKLIKYLKQNVKENDYVILTGSIPNNMSYKIYGNLCEIINNLNANCVIDSYGETLKYAITKKPFLIKPNIDELALTANIEIKNESDIIKASNILLNNGAQNILVSMAEKGALFANKNIIIKCPVGSWNDKLVNAAGSGDTMLAGFWVNL
ncbi:1-phosphofructokinase family hexose kinase [Spiroplasma apis]|uniref:1-phosphofructokinase n=1 Tax=Spiroplasma apis B31 TaxID=1276258 RepID=V5RIK9_SPIAP|nr:1-phosphofructokinase family hexose kinase [Spiroplasma apis]AHB36318.1 1-phosphofructokinase [Spiroplasma apis B31]